MIKLIVLDVDGVLTDGTVFYDNFGNEYKGFNVKDGYAIKRALSSNVEVAIISGRRSKAVEKRCEELGVSKVFQGVSNKLEVLEKLCNEMKISFEEVAAMGDDIPDIPILKSVGFSAAPIDAVEEVKEVVNFVSKREGGRGAVREFIDYILSLNGKQ
ncbi:3-deoxy-D-manno-octulosonate 8-phosphate phosphatase (KDO 8-P phosphatase) [Desulfurobacterium pacificum]|uniref:3-deoxy-D-manno-octulosonate 8-phosphate phosphatase (KDO 8-P phosphatase) n=1 Tax=Desulfurobacterium pacificum TaxID=240166 RepID=A0ABY1NDS6_9BACT|nr:HAD-IIIA family hydrolase [Desulfurobacterium pacificum]SMP06843.1 3-deoxy-D-manno-octulosonate 8-phosphate phosphatase (KDO 8-P phosphatase) [Desulfurobacterium pacificum]